MKKPPKSSALTIKKLPKAPDAATAVDGQFAWIWKQDPPEPVRAALEQLCPDVPYLGTSESPVRLTAVTAAGFDATHDLNPEAGLFTAGGTGVDRPVTGRLAELSQAHRTANGTPPSAAKDKYTTDEHSRSAVPGRKAVETAWYTPRQGEPADVPWPQVIMIPMDEPVPEQDRVALGGRRAPRADQDDRARRARGDHRGIPGRRPPPRQSDRTAHARRRDTSPETTAQLAHHDPGGPRSR